MKALTETSKSIGSDLEQAEGVVSPCLSPPEAQRPLGHQTMVYSLLNDIGSARIISFAV